jgi:hypothetical protein
MFYPVAILISMATFVAQPALHPASAPQQQVAPAAKATLAQSLEEWVRTIEADDPKAAAKLAANEQAAGQIAEHWAAMKANHKTFDYRKWIAGQSGEASAVKIGDATAFTVGGHSYGHLHIEWAKAGDDWRIGEVWNVPVNDGAWASADEGQWNGATADPGRRRLRVRK